MLTLTTDCSVHHAWRRERANTATTQNVAPGGTVRVTVRWGWGWGTLLTSPCVDHQSFRHPEGVEENEAGHSPRDENHARDASSKASPHHAAGVGVSPGI